MPLDLTDAPSEPRALHAWGSAQDLWSRPLPELVALHRELARHLLPSPILAIAHSRVLGGGPTDSPALFGPDGEVATEPGHALTEGGAWARGILCVQARGRLGWSPAEAATWRPWPHAGEDAGHWDGVEAVKTTPLAPEALDEALRWGLVMRAGEILGLTRAVRDLAATHALTRFQFEKPIGAFQYIQGKLVSLELHLEAAPGLIEEAVAGGLPEARVAKAFCSRLAKRAAFEGHQVLAATGYAAEHPMARLSSRLMAAALSLGDEERQYAALATERR